MRKKDEEEGMRMRKKMAAEEMMVMKGKKDEEEKERMGKMMKIELKETGMKEERGMRRRKEDHPPQVPSMTSDCMAMIR